MGHTCEVCSRDVSWHDGRCSTGEPLKIEHPAYVSEGGVEHRASVDHHPAHYHLPPLCCPGCPCRSYEEAHPETIGTPVAEGISDRRILRILSYHQVLTMEELVEAEFQVGAWRGIGLKRNLAIWNAIRVWKKEQADAATVQ